MRLRPLHLAFVITLSSLSANAAHYVRINCDDQFRQISWPALTTAERSIGEAFNKIVSHSGTTNMTNCSTEYPTDGYAPLWGTRRVVLDQQWYAIRIVDGKEVRVFRQEGIKIEYRLLPGVSGQIREVDAVWVCRTPEHCKAMGIPFSGGHQPTPTPTPGPGPTPG